MGYTEQKSREWRYPGGPRGWARGAAFFLSFDCAEGEFCEPTLNQCLPQPVGPLCELRPENVTFEPAIEWHWDGWSMDPDFKQVQSTPAIADIDGDGLPEVATVAYKNSSNNMLIVLNGEDGSENLMIPVSTYNVRWGTGPAVGNMDADAELEIVFMTHSPRELVVIEHDGTEKWAVSLSGTGQGYPALANLDDDPEPEVIIGGQWFDNDGTLMQDKAWLAKKRRVERLRSRGYQRRWYARHGGRQRRLSRRWHRGVAQQQCARRFRGGGRHEP